MISVTLQFNDFAAAAHALMRIATPEQFATAGLDSVHTLAVGAGRATATATTAGTVIEYHDRPDVGAPVAPPLPPLSTTPTPLADINAAAAFGGAVVQAAPLVPVLPPAAPPTPPTPPAAPSAPTAATAPTAVPGTVERDSTGLPWDARIHASTKTKVASGAWTAKRNVDPAFKAQVEADLRGLPAPAAAAPAVPVAPPAAPPAPAPVAPPAARTFAQYMAEIGGMFSARPVDAHNAMTAALAPHGMQHVGQLAGKPELIDAVDAAFKAALG